MPATASPRRLGAGPGPVKPSLWVAAPARGSAPAHARG